MGGPYIWSLCRFLATYLVSIIYAALGIYRCREPFPYDSWAEYGGSYEQGTSYHSHARLTITK